MKKLVYLAVAICLVMTGVVFNSCNGQQNVESSYQFGYRLDPSNTVDDATLAQFELSEDGMVVIYNEMKKTADQSSDASRSCIWKSTREKAISSAKKAFAAGMEAVRKDNASFKGIKIQLTMDDPDTNKPIVIETATI